MANGRKSIDIKTQITLWGKAAGRCEFPGCNKLLYEELLAEKRSNLSNIAHIVADSPDGSRSDKQRSKVLASDINNLMLICREHHKLIDDYPNDYPEEILLAMKREHEDRIKPAGSMSHDMRTQIVLYAANIGKQNAPVAYQDAIDAIQGQFIQQNQSQ